MPRRSNSRRRSNSPRKARRVNNRRVKRGGSDAAGSQGENKQDILLQITRIGNELDTIIRDEVSIPEVRRNAYLNVINKIRSLYVNEEDDNNRSRLKYHHESAVNNLRSLGAESKRVADEKEFEFEQLKNKLSTDEQIRKVNENVKSDNSVFNESNVNAEDLGRNVQRNLFLDSQKAFNMANKLVSDREINQIKADLNKMKK